MFPTASAYIPSPIFFGNAIDQACLLWNVKCNRNGSCLLYDIVHFRFLYIGIAAGLKVISLCFFVAVWYFIRRRTIREAEAARQANLPESAPLASEANVEKSSEAPPSSQEPGAPSGGTLPASDNSAASENNQAVVPPPQASTSPGKPQNGSESQQSFNMESDNGSKVMYSNSASKGHLCSDESRL